VAEAEAPTVEVDDHGEAVARRNKGCIVERGVEVELDWDGICGDLVDEGGLGRLGRCKVVELHA